MENEKVKTIENVANVIKWIKKSNPHFIKEMTTEELAERYVDEHLTITEELIKFCDSIKKYERESQNLIGFDERTSEEFVDIYLTKK